MVLDQPRKYSIVYADPPWEFLGWNQRDSGTRSAARHYPVQSLDRIAVLPVGRIAAPDSCLFLWATYPCLRMAFDVVGSWGFRYATVAFTWAKTTKCGKWHMGCGYWTRANPEICLLAIKGHPRRVSRAIRNLVVSPVGLHSRKPPEIRDMIVSLVGDLPRIELFARECVPGWDAWGNEIHTYPLVHTERTDTVATPSARLELPS